MTDTATACRNAAQGLLRTARAWKASDNQSEASRLARNARWYWHRYLMLKEERCEADALRDLRQRSPGDTEAISGDLALHNPQADRGKQLRRPERLDRPRALHAMHGN